MTTEADAEYERIRRKYAPVGPRELMVLAIVASVLVVASLVGLFDWPFILGGIIGVAAWEFTKLRLRRNARDFAETWR